MNVPTQARYNHVYRIIKSEAGGSRHCGRVLGSRRSTSCSCSGNSASREASSSAGASSGGSGSTSTWISDLNYAMPGIIVGRDGSGHSRYALEWAMKEAAIRQLTDAAIEVHGLCE